MSERTSHNCEYTLGHANTELQRLQNQGAFLYAWTHALLKSAGVCPCMRVLDIGCGAGDVSLMLAEMVGPGGEVIGIDLGESAIQQAERRARALGLNHVRFLRGDEHTAVAMAAEGRFDAVVGRFVLVHQLDPARFARTLAKGLQPGGLLIFQDPDYSILLRARPFSPLLEQIRRWILASHEIIKVPTDISFLTPGIFEAAGLPAPNRRLTCPVVTAPHDTVCELCAQLMGSLQQFLIAAGVATAEEIGVDTLAERLCNELKPHGSVVQTLCLSDAWVKLP